MVETRAARRQRDALDGSCTPPPLTPVRLTSLLREHYVDETHCALQPRAHRAADGDETALQRGRIRRVHHHSVAQEAKELERRR